MNPKKDPSMFESLNAKLLSPKQVANSFIAPDCFQDVIQKNHNILIGPRGSGKTTLLKMLQVQSLAEWTKSEVEKYIRRINYISAFIATDLTWQKQWEKIDQLEINTDSKSHIKDSIFTIHTIISIVEALEYCRNIDIESSNLLEKFAINLSKLQESQITNEICELLDLELAIPSLTSLEMALRKRLVKIGELVNRAIAQRVAFSDTEYSFIYKDFLSTITTVIDVINLISGRKEQKWTLLFDELEIAPDSIRVKLLEALRGNTGNIIYKLSISPYSQDFELLHQLSAPSPTNDYQPIPLWYTDKKKAEKFCLSLFKQMSKSILGKSIPPQEVFGNSIFETGNQQKSAYSPGSKIHEYFLELQEKDPSFDTYLKKQSININKMHEMSYHKSSSTVRKITNIVKLRNAYLKESGQKRSRKSPHLYTGWNSLFDITEGNPRNFIGLMTPLLRQFKKEGTKVPVNSQTDAIMRLANRFMALLSTIPVEENVNYLDIRGLNDLIDLIGECFGNQLYSSEFKAEPPTTFIIDKRVPETLLNLLGRALNSGAIIYLDNDIGQQLIDDLRDKRFRLNFLLAQYYKLTLTSISHRNLSNILNLNKDEIENGQINFLKEIGE